MTLLQQLDPPGVGARNLQECILLQIQADQSAPKLAYQVIDQHFDEFVEHDWSQIMNQLKIKNQEIAQIISYIKTLSPAPGSVFGTEEIGYIYPDLIFKVNNLKKKVEVTLTKKTNPEIIFKQSYFEKFVNLPDQEIKNFLQQKRSEYKTLINNLEQRGTTILKVGKEIANFQKDFFLGENHTLKPLLLRDVAQKLQLHESTISRAVNGKYLKCDFGVFELKSFFKRPISSKANADLSAESIQVQIKALIKTEDPQHPLSDSKLVKVLADSKIFLSRRTVAKYREELHIPSSTKRKQKE
ncbi:RNA polymerase factor sigma-54 [Lactobacillus amylolyticus]|uniref:RNA polymerase factor sigma-54 n=1 Tax=Lactobacillus amylolyticus TaxID=83683 RepID=UPI002491B314|nr:RNA polymerase factor sigma-54 [Lactobacillus amylolyticus]